MDQLARYEVELTQDGLIEIGALYNDKSVMEEVFICAAKYLKYWGMDEMRFRATMAEFHLNEVLGLKFVDEYPMTTEPLRLHNSEAKETQEVLQHLKQVAQ